MSLLSVVDLVLHPELVSSDAPGNREWVVVSVCLLLPLGLQLGNQCAQEGLAPSASVRAALEMKSPPWGEKDFAASKSKLSPLLLALSPWPCKAGICPTSFRMIVILFRDLAINSSWEFSGVLQGFNQPLPLRGDSCCVSWGWKTPGVKGFLLQQGQERRSPEPPAFIGVAAPSTSPERKLRIKPG